MSNRMLMRTAIILLLNNISIMIKSQWVSTSSLNTLSQSLGEGYCTKRKEERMFHVGRILELKTA